MDNGIECDRNDETLVVILYLPQVANALANASAAGVKVLKFLEVLEGTGYVGIPADIARFLRELSELLYARLRQKGSVPREGYQHTYKTPSGHRFSITQLTGRYVRFFRSIMSREEGAIVKVLPIEDQRILFQRLVVESRQPRLDVHASDIPDEVFEAFRDAVEQRWEENEGG